MAQVQRITKPLQHRATKQRNRLFEFDLHYALAAVHCQQVSNNMAIPRLVGTQCKQYDENHGEYFALWHSALFTTPRCPGPGACCDPTIFSHFLQRRSINSLKHRYAPAWRARVAELKILAARGKTKTLAAKRIPTPLDTTIVKQWWPAQADQDGAAQPRTENSCLLAQDDEDGAAQPRAENSCLLAQDEASGAAHPRAEHACPPALQRIMIIAILLQKFNAMPGHVSLYSASSATSTQASMSTKPASHS